MNLAGRAGALALVALLIACAPHTPPPDCVLRVCADPNNVLFSNEAREGFETESLSS